LADLAVIMRYFPPTHKKLAAFVAALSLTFPLSLLAVEEKGQLPLEELRTFADVYNQIRIGYVEEIDDSTLLEYAIQGMLMGLDPHSVYLTEDAFQDLQDNTSGEFTGLGLEVGMEDGYVEIISPIDGSPAAAAGLQSGDVILKLGKVPVKGMSLNEAIDVMRGPKGSDIELTIGRPGESQPFEVTLTRDTIKVASVRERWLEPGYGYIRVAQFQTATGADVGKSLDKLMAKDELKGLVLDLRNNPGGILRASVDVAGLFMDGGNVVYTEGRLANSDMYYEADEKDASDGTPLVVLINSGSASASEIVAALYFTPNGRSIQAEGIEPDILVERAKVTAYKGSPRITEADLSGHLGNGNGKGKSTKDSGEDKVSKKAASELLSSDNQLYEALTLLKGINVLGMRDSKTDG
jgi:carboxyl-terminal processing protease